MYLTLFRFYTWPDGQKKEKEAYNPSKAVVIEHEVEQLIIYYYIIKG